MFEQAVAVAGGARHVGDHDCARHGRAVLAAQVQLGREAAHDVHAQRQEEHREAHVQPQPRRAETDGGYSDAWHVGEAAEIVWSGGELTSRP